MLTTAIIMAVAAVLGLLGGFLAFFLKYGTALAFASRDSKQALEKAGTLEKEMAAQKEHVSLMESSLSEIKASLSKLGLIEQLMASVNALKELYDERTRSQGKSIDDLKDEVKALRSKN